MSITETLFGGLLVVVMIFFIGRRFGLSNYWSGILGGTLPFLAYLGYSAGHLQGGDVLAIHLVVFMATAAVLGVFSSVRKKKEKLHWAPRLIIVFFVLLAIMMAILISISANGLPDSMAKRLLPNSGSRPLHTAFPGVIPHDRNKLYEAHQQRVKEQRDLGWQVKLDGLERLRKGVGGDLELNVTDAKGEPVAVEHAMLGLWRMANSQDDRRISLTPAANGVFSTSVNLPDAGRWIVEISLQRGGDTYLVQLPFTVAE